MSSLLKPILYTSLALIAFAGNSVLCRIALIEDNIDAGSFTYIRLFSGAITLLVLFLIAGYSNKKSLRSKALSNESSQLSFEIKHFFSSPDLYTRLLPAVYLFIYAIGFSYAYVSLETGTGALILFAAVQLTIVLSNFLTTKQLLKRELIGLTIAFAGLVVLVYPTLSTPSLFALLPMSIAGIAWGLYTLSGKKTNDPLKSTTLNFILSLPLVLLALILTANQIEITDKGLMLAIASGAVTSGLGYFLWFIALRYLSAMQSGVLQLLVPIIATLGGVVFAGEPLTLTLLIALLLVLGGIFIVLTKQKV